jgi:hypothetical protein
MQDDELSRILRRAEADLPPATFTTTELAARVHRAHNHQRRRRRAVLAAVPVVAIIAAAGWSLTHNAERSPSTALQIAASKQLATPQARAFSEADIARLQAEAAAHTQAARAMIAARPRPSVLLAEDPLADVHEQVDVVAYRMILEADSKQSAMRPSAESINIYHRVLELFPTSHSAELARQRLNQTISSQGESS